MLYRPACKMSDPQGIRKPYLPFRGRTRRVATKREFTFTRSWASSEAPLSQHAEVTNMLDGRGKIIRVTELSAQKKLSQAVSESPVPLIITSPAPQIIHSAQKDDDSEEEMQEDQQRTEYETDGSTVSSIPRSTTGSITEAHNVQNNVVLNVRDGQVQPQTAQRKKNPSFIIRDEDDSEDSENDDISESPPQFDDRIEGGHFRSTNASPKSLSRMSQAPSFRMQRHSTPKPQSQMKAFKDSIAPMTRGSPSHKKSTSKLPITSTSNSPQKSPRPETLSSPKSQRRRSARKAGQQKTAASTSPMMSPSSKHRSSLAKIPQRSPRLESDTSKPPLVELEVAALSVEATPLPTYKPDIAASPRSLTRQSIRRKSSPIKKTAVSEYQSEHLMEDLIPTPDVRVPLAEPEITPTTSHKAGAAEQKRSLFSVPATKSIRNKSLLKNKSINKSNAQTTLDAFIFKTPAVITQGVQPSQRAERPAAVPVAPVVSHEMPSDINVWQDGGSRRGISHITDLDIVMNELDETAWEIKERTVDHTLRKAIKRFMRKTDADIQQTISDSHAVVRLKATVSKSSATVRRKRKALLEAQERNINLKAEINQLKRRRVQEEVPYRDPKSLHNISAFLTKLTNFHHDIRNAKKPKRSPKKFHVYKHHMSSKPSSTVCRRLISET